MKMILCQINVFSRVLLISVLFMSIATARAQTIDKDAKIKSQYIYGFTKYFAWPNQEYLKEFTIGVLGMEPGISMALMKMAETKTVMGKPIKIKRFISIEAVTKTQLLYVNKNSGFNISQILRKLNGRSTLLVSENYAFHESMINFVVINSQQNFELNKGMIDEHGLTMSPKLDDLAITTSDEWHRLYEESQGHLKSEQEKVQQQQQELAEMEKERKKQLKLIANAKQEIEKQAGKIKTQKLELGDLMSENAGYQESIEEKVKTLRYQRSEIMAQETAILNKQKEAHLQDEILQEKLDVIRGKEKEIETQNEVLDEQMSALEKQRLIIFLFIALVILIAFFVVMQFRNIRHNKRVNQQLEHKNHEIEREKEKSDQLLLNILPVKTAEELKRNGKATARYYNMVTVMFTDFVGFTKIAESFTPTALVKELDHCFIHFDEIIDQYHLEKIKTIGDAYMCAGGVPIRTKPNPIFVTLAALAIQEFMSKWKVEKEAKGESAWDIRIGIHTGPLTAGVVGRKKFAYDVWGDTVNTASRMESSGKPGTVNVSGHTYERIKEYFVCTYRGKVQAKGKGELDMYFVDGIKPDLALNGSITRPNEKFEKVLAGLKAIE